MVRFALGVLLFRRYAHRLNELFLEILQFWIGIGNNSFQVVKSLGGWSFLSRLFDVQILHIVNRPKLGKPGFLRALMAFLGFAKPIPNVGRVFSALYFDGDELFDAVAHFLEDADVWIGRKSNRDLSLGAVQKVDLSFRCRNDRVLNHRMYHFENETIGSAAD